MTVESNQRKSVDLSFSLPLMRIESPARNTSLQHFRFYLGGANQPVFPKYSV